MSKILKIVDNEQRLLLSGKVAIVNGASSEIGQAITEALLENEAVVAGTYNKNQSKVGSLVENYGKKRVLGFGIDFLSEEWESNIETAVTQTKAEFGKIDILINVSGVWFVKPFLYEEKKEIEEIWRVNYWAPYCFIQKAIRHMLETGGDIINIASTAGLKGTGQESSYSASKGALINLTGSLAEEFAPRMIKVNAILPGYTNTAALDKYFDKAMKELLIKHIPMGRLCEPTDVARAVLGILMNDYMTGMNIVLHGARI